MLDQKFVDKTLLELWILRAGSGGLSHEEYEYASQDISFRAINAIKMMKKEIERLKEENN